MSSLAVRNTDSLDQYMREVRRYPVLGRDEEHALAVRFKDQGDVSAAHALVVSNLRFVVKVAHEFRGYGLKLLDLVQEGNVGLMVAVKKFDPSKGYRLISYAVWWIRAHMQSFIMRSWSLVRLGAGHVQRKLFFKLRSARAAAASRGQDVSDAMLAASLDVPEPELADMQARLASRDFSLDAQLGEAGQATHLEQLADADGVDAEEALGEHQEQLQLRRKVADAMGTLNDKERYIVEQRMLSDAPRTLQEIGDTFKVSRERVRQLESRVLAKLREKFTPLEAHARS